MKKELTENLADFIINQNKNLTVTKGWSKNILRPIRADGTDVESKPLNRANKAFIGVPGTKTQHKSNAAFLALVPKEDKIGKRKRKFKTVTNRFGRKVLQGHTKIVRKSDTP